MPAIFLKNAKHHIIYTWIVLICFAVGQVMVFAHQHTAFASKYRTHATSQDKTTVTEKCQLCDAMHHNSMVVTHHQYLSPLLSTDQVYKQGKYDFISIALILSAGRSPPIS